MKSASFPSLRVEPALRQAVESVLQEGETVSSFVERSVRALVRLRQDQEAFVSRGLAARERGRRDGAYVDADDVLEALASRLEKAKAHRS
jgi:predicted transcriptional regulator